MHMSLLSSVKTVIELELSISALFLADSHSPTDAANHKGLPPPSSDHRAVLFPGKKRPYAPGSLASLVTTADNTRKRVCAFH